MTPAHRLIGGTGGSPIRRDHVSVVADLAELSLDYRRCRGGNPDTVSVIVAFRSVQVSSRLTTIAEGESLFNGGITLVLLSLITTIHLQGSFSLSEGLQQMAIAFVGGGLLGVGLGYLCIGLFRQLDDALSNILLTVAVSLGTFQIGQALGVSSAIAVVVAGLVIGNLGFRRTTASTRVTLLNFWEYAGFGVNPFIFLLVGTAVEPLILIQTIPAALLAVVAYQMGAFWRFIPCCFCCDWAIAPCRYAGSMVAPYEIRSGPVPGPSCQPHQ
jgi:CPA1 family monovalent cation:H+ antiporter